MGDGIIDYIEVRQKGALVLVEVTLQFEGDDGVVEQVKHTHDAGALFDAKVIADPADVVVRDDLVAFEKAHFDVMKDAWIADVEARTVSSRVAVNETPKGDKMGSPDENLPTLLPGGDPEAGPFG